jgi:hypothetical protein
MVYQPYKLPLIMPLLSLTGCSRRTFEQAAEGIGVLFAGFIGFFLLCGFALKVHKSLGEQGQKTWEKICGIVFLILFILLCLLGGGGGDMEYVWRGR